MSETKISSFFSPVSTKSVKRNKPDSSPELIDSSRVAEMENEKVGELTRGQLMGDMSTLLGNILDQKLSSLATKEDIGIVSRKIADLEQENACMKEELMRMREQEKQILGKLVDLEGRSRRNNLIFKGLKWSGNNPDYRYIVRQFCIQELGCDDQLWVNRAHPLGRDRTLVIAHIPQDVDIEYIMSRAYMVRSKGYTIFRDYPVEIRRKRAFLFAVRQEVERVVGRRKMPVDFDHLKINGVRFTWEDDGLRAGAQEGAVKLQELFKRDFSSYLNKLKSDGPRFDRMVRENEQNVATKAVGNETTSVTNNQAEVTRGEAGSANNAAGR